MSNGDIVAGFVILGGVVVGIVLLMLAWKLFLSMITQTTRAVRLGVQSDEDRALIQLGRIAAQEITRTQQVTQRAAAPSQYEPLLDPDVAMKHTTHVCPNCSAYVRPTDDECHKCGALFTDPSGWRPQPVQS